MKATRRAGIAAVAACPNITLVKDIVACGFLTVPTMTYKVLFVFIMLAHHHLRIIY